MLFSGVVGCCKTSNLLKHIIHFYTYFIFTFSVNRRYSEVFLSVQRSVSAPKAEFDP